MFLGAAVIFFYQCGGGVFFIWGRVWGIELFFLIGGGGVCTFLKLMSRGGHHNCFLDGGGGVCKKVPPALPL